MPAGLVVVAVLVGLLGAACSDDSVGDQTSGTSTTASTISFEERDAALQLNLAATGMNLIAGDIGLLAATGKAVDYCRSKAPGELEPHQSVLEAAADPGVRQRGKVALADLRTAIGLCADGAGSAVVQEAIDAYNASFGRLRQRIDTLIGSGG